MKIPGIAKLRRAAAGKLRAPASRVANASHQLAPVPPAHSHLQCQSSGRTPTKFNFSGVRINPSRLPCLWPVAWEEDPNRREVQVLPPPARGAARRARLVTPIRRWLIVPITIRRGKSLSRGPVRTDVRCASGASRARALGGHGQQMHALCGSGLAVWGRPRGARPSAAVTATPRLCVPRGRQRRGRPDGGTGLRL
jgi:hypothetical protein